MLESEQSNLSPYYVWVEDLAKLTGKDAKSIIELCERGLIDAKKTSGRWAIHVIRFTTPQAGAAIVHDVKAGRDVTIGSVIGQYITLDGKDRVRDEKERKAQIPVRDKVDVARRWIHMTWYVLGGGALFFLVGLVLSWPVAALLIIPACSRANEAVKMAEAHGETALISEARSIQTQAHFTALGLWGIIVLIVLIGIASAASS